MSDGVLVWWTIIKHLKNYAKAQPELEGTAVRAGAKKPKDPYPCIEILWDDETGISLFTANKGELTIWIDVWIRSDEKDPGTAYDILNGLQNQICVVLIRWTDVLLDDLGIAVKLSLREAVSDGDSNRPLAGSRMVIEIEWRR